jgi:hypothetical protein
MQPNEKQYGKQPEQVSQPILQPISDHQGPKQQGLDYSFNDFINVVLTQECNALQQQSAEQPSNALEQSSNTLNNTLKQDNTLKHLNNTGKRQRLNSETAKFLTHLLNTTTENLSAKQVHSKLTRS